MAAFTASSHASSRGFGGSSTATHFCKVQLFGTWLCPLGAVLQEGCSSDFSNATPETTAHTAV